MKLRDVIPHLPADPCFIVVDPGKRTGVLLRVPGRPWVVTDVPLDDLPVLLTGLVGSHDPAFVACEDFSLSGRQNDPKVTAAQGIGMCKAVCLLMEKSLVLLQRGDKTAGHKALDTEGKVAFSTARNDHRRDVVDFGGYVLRELHAYNHNAARR